MQFKATNLDERIQNHLASIGFENCTPIQEKTIDPIINGRDISGLAQTGTGKTAAFLLPLMHRLLKSKDILNKSFEPGEDDKDYFPRYQENKFSLILVPTRELAEQVLQAFEQFKGDFDLKAVAVYGGVDIEPQKKKIKDGVDFVIATPGRLIDLYKSHSIDLKQVCAIVFDEADRMFDMGFKDEMVYLLQRVPRERQFLVFSATLNFDVLTVAYQFESDPLEVQIDRDQPTAENVDHSLFHIGQEDKPAYLLSILKKENPEQIIIFSNFRHQIEKIVSFLNRNGYPAMGISSLLNQKQRNRVLEQFKAENKKNIMVATDVAARGLDIKGVDLVVNYELPDDAENYVHRIGRTGRAGNKGVAYSLCSDLDVASLQRIESYLKEKVEIAWLDEGDILKDFSSFPTISGPKKHSHKGKRSGGAKGKSRDNDKRGKRPSRSGSAKSDKTKGGKPYNKKSKHSNKSAASNNPNKKRNQHNRKRTNNKYTSRRVKPKQSLVQKIISKLKFWS